MNVKINYEKVRFVFDQVDVKPFGGSVEFRLIDGQLETAKNYLAYPVFIACIRNAIENHRKELCN